MASSPPYSRRSNAYLIFKLKNVFSQDLNLQPLTLEKHRNQFSAGTRFAPDPAVELMTLERVREDASDVSEDGE